MKDAKGHVTEVATLSERQVATLLMRTGPFIVKELPVPVMKCREEKVALVAASVGPVAVVKDNVEMLAVGVVRLLPMVRLLPLPFCQIKVLVMRVSVFPLVKDKVLNDPPSELTLPVTETELMVSAPMTADGAVMEEEATMFCDEMLGHEREEARDSVLPVPATKARVENVPAFIVMEHASGRTPTMVSTVILSVTVMPAYVGVGEATIWISE